MIMREPCQPQIGTCHLQGLNHVLLEFLLTLNTSWKEYRVESRNEAFCGWGRRTGTTDLQVDIFRSQFYEPNSCMSSYLEKYKNPLWWLFPMPSRNFQEMSRNLLQKQWCSYCMHFFFTRITCILIFPLPLWSSFSELSKVLSFRLYSSLFPQ